MKIKALLVVLLVIVNLSCVSVISEGDFSYKGKQIGKTLNVVNLYTKKGFFGKENFTYYDVFATEFDNVLNNNYDITSKTVVSNNYKFDSFDVNKELEQFDADTIIEITQTHTVIDEANNEVSATFLVRIYDVLEDKIMWQCEIMDDYPSGQDAKFMVDKLSKIIIDYQTTDGFNFFKSKDPTLSIITESTEYNDDTKPEMIYVKAGSFYRGISKVTLTKDFYISKFEVTQKLYSKVMGKNPSRYKGDQKPVDSVSWYDSINFCNKLSLMNGKTPVYDVRGENVSIVPGSNGYRLPTDTEWEYAAIGGNEMARHIYSGSDNLSDVAWSKRNSAKTHDVGTKNPNELGIYDMSGNVWEWCYDWYGSFDNIPTTDPVQNNPGRYRIARGGSWYTSDLKFFKVDYRSSFKPKTNWDNNGFRVVINSEPEENTSSEI